MTDEPKRGRGRPRLGDGQTVRVPVLVPEAQYTSWVDAAGDQGVGPWLRDLGNRAAKRKAK